MSVTSTSRRVASAAAVVAVGLALAACGSSRDGSPGAGPGAPEPGTSASVPRLSGTVTVLAAASLTDSFTELGRVFEHAHPGVTVRFDFGGSSSLARSIVSGAPADVFAAADTRTMRTVTDAGAVDGVPEVFARNRLEIAVPTGNPAHVRALADLARPEVKVALCAPQVPCGAAAERALAAGGVTLTPVTLEQNVKGALTKVVLGEVDAALVYRTDVNSARGSVRGIDFAQSEQAVNDYPIALLDKAPNAVGARAFIALVESAEGHRVLTAAGFQKS